MKRVSGCRCSAAERAAITINLCVDFVAPPSRNSGCGTHWCRISQAGGTQCVWLVGAAGDVLLRNSCDGSGLPMQARPRCGRLGLRVTLNLVMTTATAHATPAHHDMTQFTQPLFADHAFLMAGWRRDVLLQWAKHGALFPSLRTRSCLRSSSARGVPSCIACRTCTRTRLSA